jgi:hypothetical protein
VGVRDARQEASGLTDGNVRDDLSGGAPAWSRRAFAEELSQFTGLDNELDLKLHRLRDISEPDNAIVHMGRILEAILTDYWRRSPAISGSPDRTATLEVLAKNLFPKLPEAILVHVQILQRMRNLAAHKGSSYVDEGDAADAVRRLTIVLKWFGSERREMDRAAAGGAVPESDESSPEVEKGSAAGSAASRSWPGSGFEGDNRPPLWTVTVTGPWICADIHDKPVIVQGHGPFLQTVSPGGPGSAVEGPGHDPITDLIATADGSALAVLTGERIAWAARDPDGWRPLTWVIARFAVPGSRLLAGIRRRAGVELILADAGQTFRLRVDSRGATSRPAPMSSWPARSAALVESEEPELVIVSNEGELGVVNRTAQGLPPLPGHGWLAVDAAHVGTARAFAGLRQAEDGSCLYVSRSGRQFKARLSGEPDTVQVGRSVLAGRLGSVIATQVGRTLTAWRCEDLESTSAVPANHADDGGNG